MSISKSKLKRYLTLFLALMFILLSVTACGNGDTVSPTGTNAPTDSASTNTPSADEPQYGGVLDIVNTAEGAQPLGVPWENTTNDTSLLQPCIETLLREDSAGNVYPFLATDWTIDLDAKTATFNLQEGVKFHDGTDFNAEAAVFGLQHSIDAKVLSQFTSASVVDEYTIVLTFETYMNSALNALASRSQGFVSPTAFEENGLEWARQNPVGTGPFKFDSFQRGDVLKYVKNENYWQEGKPYLDGVSYHFIKDTMTQQAAMQASGDERIDVLNSTSGEQVSTLMGMGLEVLNLPIGPLVLVPSSADTSSPLNDLKVRQAIYYAIERDSIVAARGFGIWTSAYQYVPSVWAAHISGHDANPYDPEKARELLAEAGYPNGFTTTIICMPNFVDKDAIVAVQSQLAEVGITIALEFPDSGGYLAQRKGTWDGMLAQHMRCLSNINTTYRIYIDKAIGDLPDMMRSDEILAAVQASVTSESVDDDLTQAVNQLMFDDMIVIPLYNVYDSFVVQTNVHDTGFADWGSSTRWIPEDAWLSAD